MNRDQFNRSEMFNTVAATMQTNNAQWGGVPAIVQTVTELNQNIQLMGQKMMRQQTPTTGAAEQKAQVRLDFEEKILEFADQIHALASANHDMNLAGQSDLTLSALDKMPDDALEETGQLIADLTVANQAALEDYGLLGDDLTDLNTLKTQFHNVKTTPRTAVTTRAAETNTLPELLTATTSLLRNRLDKQMRKFKKGNPVFYQAYLSARVIVDKGAPPAPAKNPAPPSS